ncbi:hypothetical protein DFH09DRAFT_1246123 [Mycena vulgaris]|nr:hypothetical protein DFH09DRAFT_1246123 [Mycena vulgaris]
MRTAYQKNVDRLPLANEYCSNEYGPAYSLPSNSSSILFVFDKPLPAIQHVEDTDNEPAANNRHSFIRRSPPARTTPLTPIEATFMSTFKVVELPEVQTKIDNVATISSAGGALASAVNLDVKSIENTITTFAETSAVLMKGLDALGQLHPFVGVAVTAFKLVITLDLTRRQNNKKVLVVKIQMQDLMTVLFQLRHMHDPEEKGPDGTTLKDRMLGLMSSIAKDITACGSACDVYMKKSFLAKTLKSKIYENRLAAYVTMFANRKKEIGFALKVHTALGVDEANKKLDGQDVHLKLIEEKMEALFRKLDSPRERDVQKFITEKGGPKACVDDDGTLQELITKSGQNIALMDLTHSGNGDLASAKKLYTKELAEDVDEAFKKNMKLFDRKLRIQSKQLKDAISATGEHIISALSSGAHDRILDTELQAIWKDMGWKGSVKARYFVLALNDYYTEKFATNDIKAVSAPPTSSVAKKTGKAIPKDDRWALKYVNVTHVQAILEAVDDDGTGFVSIKEANDFAVSRPKGWSLLRWVALWAAGWHGIVTWYKNRIYNLLKAMLRLVRRVHPSNRTAVDTYLGGDSIQQLELLLRSTRSAPANLYKDPKLTEIADAFQNEEVEGIAERLASVLYELDDVSTVRLVTGPGRIERYVYPLVYVMMLRHFDIIRLACKHVLDPAEFQLMNYSLRHIFDAIRERTESLEAVFKQTNLDVKARLGNFAFGMFQASYGADKYDPINNTIVSWEEDLGYAYSEEDLGPESDDDEETQATIFDGVDRTILSYILLDASYETYNFEADYPPPTTSDAIDGVWAGHLLRVTGDGLSSSAAGLLSLVITRTEDALSGGAENITAVSVVSGTVDAEHKVEFTIKWPDNGGVKGWVVTCKGRYDPETDTITGSWESPTDIDSPLRSFVFHRTPSYVYRFRYTPAEFAANPARARWAFAIAAVMNDVQRTCWAWRYFKQRFAERKQFVPLIKADKITSQELTPWIALDSDETATLELLKAQLPPADARFYAAIADYELQHLVAFGRKCDSCERKMTECLNHLYSDGINICIECIDQTPERDAFVHLASHVLVKFTRYVHDGELATVLPQARVVANRVKAAFRASKSLLSRLEAGPSLGDHHAQNLPMVCCCCGEVISCPCWACVTCVPDTFICSDCDGGKATALPDGPSPHHNRDHPLVQIRDSEPVLEPLTTESRLADLEAKISGLESKVEERLSALEEKLEGRFLTLETILQQISSQLAAKPRTVR